MLAYFFSIPNEKESLPKERLQVITYVDLGPPPSIIPEAPAQIPAAAKPTFGALRAAKKGEVVDEFELPKNNSPQIGDVKVEAPKPVEKKAEPVDETFYVAVDIMPEPFGGMERLQQNVNYPAAAKTESVVGKVLIKAFINENGEVVRAEVVKGIGFGCDEEALWVVKSSRFKPAKKNGKQVKVQLTIPISFKPS